MFSLLVASSDTSQLMAQLDRDLASGLEKGQTLPLADGRKILEVSRKSLAALQEQLKATDNELLEDLEMLQQTCRCLEARVQILSDQQPTPTYNEIRTIPIESSGIGTSSHGAITSVEGNVPTLQDARIVFLKGTNHDDNIQSTARGIFVHAHIKEKNILLIEGAPYLMPITTCISKPNQKFEEFGWDDMALHAFCVLQKTKMLQLQDLRIKKGVIFDSLIEKLRENLELRKLRPLPDEIDQTRAKINESNVEIEKIEKQIEALDLSIKTLEDDIELNKPKFIQAKIEGRNVSLKKAIHALQGKIVWVSAGANHFTADVIKEFSKEKLMILTFKDNSLNER
jgi:hypothetical protein